MSIYDQGPPGLGHVGSYEVSGRPFVSGGINVAADTISGTPLEISFPSVTRWIIITNHDAASSAPIKVGLSANGLAGDNYFTILEDYSSWKCSRTPRLELKVTKLYLTGSSTHVDIVAGLTGINTGEILNNWSGSAGVG